MQGPATLLSSVDASVTAEKDPESPPSLAHLVSLVTKAGRLGPPSAGTSGAPEKQVSAPSAAPPGRNPQHAALRGYPSPRLAHEYTGRRLRVP
ncbi:hypothetical protein NDU88_012101 [Pleurodeles waltl]|uniref:Uncharacterized protein n=1 Tax=Pleurodeles waltl TaxID=8319 RepID=A0AAV7R2B9_PLEWA|nr:hypothetical protein NDU88_012101 [Pleurodeles waltl]